MEFIAKNTKVHGKTCIGCQEKKRDVMISFMGENTNNLVHDLFLTDEQAMFLIVQLKLAIKRNEEHEPN